MQLYELLLSEHIANVPPESLVAYLIMRADVELRTTLAVEQGEAYGLIISGLLVQTIAQKTGLGTITVERSIQDLQRRGWIKIRKGKGETVFQLGTIKDGQRTWMSSTPGKPREKKELTVKEKMMAIMAESAERRAAEAKLREEKRKVDLKDMHKSFGSEVFGKELREEKANTRLIKYYRAYFEETYKETPPFVADGPGGKPEPRAYKMADQILNMCSQDLKVAFQVIEFTIKNWDRICETMKLYGRPYLNTFSAKSLFIRFKDFAQGKVKLSTGKAVTDRVDKLELDDEKKIGW